MNSLICTLQCNNITTVPELQKTAREYSGHSSFWSMDSEYVEVPAGDDREPERKYRIELPGGMMLIHTREVGKDLIDTSKPGHFILDEYVLLPDGKTEQSFKLSEKDIIVDRIETFIIKSGKVEYAICAFEKLPKILPLPFVKYCLEQKLPIKTCQGEVITPIPKTIHNSDVWLQGQHDPTLVIFGSDGASAYKMSSDLVGFVPSVIVDDPFDTEHRTTLSTKMYKAPEKIVRGFAVHGMIADEFCDDIDNKDVIDKYTISNLALFYKKDIVCPFCFPSENLETRILYSLVYMLKRFGWGALSYSKFADYLKTIGYGKIDFKKISENARIQGIIEENKRLKAQLAEAAANAERQTADLVTDKSDEESVRLRSDLETAEELLREQTELADNYKAQIDTLTAKLKVAEHRANTVTDNFFEKQLAELNRSAIFQNEAVYALHQILTEEQTRLAGVPENTRRKLLVSEMLQILEEYGVPSFEPKRLETELLTLIPKLSGTLTPGNIQALNRLGFELELNGDNHYKMWLKGYPEYVVSVSGTTKNPIGRSTPAKKLMTLLFR